MSNQDHGGFHTIFAVFAVILQSALFFGLIQRVCVE